MKITRIYLKNLNSLRGEFIIDLEKEPFASAGIFAITGATGAGKSTILDAITLALYGRAARYENKPNPENMMSRGTGECQAEVEFEVPKGRYRASWQMKQTRSKSDRKQQSVQRFVYDSQGATLAQKIREVETLIEELTGLDVDRFFRSVLLAQGDFVRFLKATPDDRAMLLESLTGTGIYSEISIQAHVETSKRENALRLREKDLENTKLLDEEQRTVLLKQIDELQVETANNNLKLRDLAELISKGNALVKLQRDQVILKEHLKTMNQENAVLETDFKRLELCRKGTLFFPKLTHLDQSLKIRNDKKADVDNAKKIAIKAKSDLRAGVDATSLLISSRITEIETVIADSFAKHNLKSTEFDCLNKWLETHRQDQTLDTDLSCIVENITSLIHNRNKTKEITDKQNTILKEQKTAQQRFKELQIEHEEAFSKFRVIVVLVDKSEKAYLDILQGKTLPDIEQETIQLSERFSFLEKKQRLSVEFEKTNKDLQRLSNLIDDLRLKNEEAQKKSLADESLLKLEREKIQLLTEKRDKNRLIASLHEHRETLVPGESCPLCGSQEHPFIGSSKKSPSELSDLENELNILVGNFSQQENSFKEHTVESAKLETTLRHKTEEYVKISLSVESIQASLSKLMQEHSQIETKVVENSLAIEKEKEVVNQKLFNSRTIAKKAQEIETQKNESQRSKIEAQHVIDLINNKIASESKIIQTLNEQFECVKKELCVAQKESAGFENSLQSYLELYKVAFPFIGEEKKLQKALEERKKMYQDNLKRCSALKMELNELNSSNRDLKSEEEKLRLKGDKLAQFSLSHEIHLIDTNAEKTIEFSGRWNTIEDAEEAWNRLHEILIKAQNTVDERTQEFAKAEANFADVELKLSQELLETEFETIAVLRAAQLSPFEFQCIQKNENDFKERFDRLHGKLSQVENDLESSLKSNAPQGELLLEIQNQQRELNKLTNEKHGDLALCKSKHQQDESNQIIHAALLKELEADRKRLGIWQKLSDLIGSHDGKIFRKFAQGLSLDLLIKHANIHLSLLSNRYRLKRIDDEQLDLEIQDLHQGSVTRPTASLSGGESFLTSLALALGLSDLAGKNVRIDSLFIDEGFGSLDAETLEVAVQALESLRSKNKTIGVISHIELLKERITTQIIIEKGFRGISTMSFSV